MGEANRDLAGLGWVDGIFDPQGESRLDGMEGKDGNQNDLNQHLGGKSRTTTLVSCTLCISIRIIRHIGMNCAYFGQTAGRFLIEWEGGGELAG